MTFINNDQVRRNFVGKCLKFSNFKFVFEFGSLHLLFMCVREILRY